jgi:hypothetical protein
MRQHFRHSQTRQPQRATRGRHLRRSRPASKAPQRRPRQSNDPSPCAACANVCDNAPVRTPIENSDTTSPGWANGRSAAGSITCRQASGRAPRRTQEMWPAAARERRAERRAAETRYLEPSPENAPAARTPAPAMPQRRPACHRETGPCCPRPEPPRRPRSETGTTTARARWTTAPPPLAGKYAAFPDRDRQHLRKATKRDRALPVAPPRQRHSRRTRRIRGQARQPPGDRTPVMASARADAT